MSDFIRNKLTTKSVQISITATILFLIVANPFLFDVVDKVFATALGTRYGSNHMLVLFVHAIIFGVLMYFANQYFFSDAYDWLARKV